MVLKEASNQASLEGIILIVNQPCPPWVAPFPRLSSDLYMSEESQLTVQSH